MKIAYLAFIVLMGISSEALARCPGGVECAQDMQYLTQNVSPDIIASIQARFNGRVIGTQTTEDGNTQIQVLDQNNNVVIVTVDSSGHVITVQE